MFLWFCGFCGCTKIQLILVSPKYFDFLRLIHKKVFYNLRNQFSTVFSFKIFEPFIAPPYFSLRTFTQQNKYNYWEQNKIEISQYSGSKSKNLIHNQAVGRKQARQRSCPTSQLHLYDNRIFINFNQTTDSLEILIPN